MNVVFLTICPINDINEKDIYNDLLRKFRDEGHNVYVVSPIERRYREPTAIVNYDNIHILRVKSLNYLKANLVEKGIGTVLIEYLFKHALKKYWDNIQFDLILYATPPITLLHLVKYLKQSTPTAKSYLLLKDIFPQNAVDLNMFKSNGLFYWYFRRKEKQLYAISDYIGCMSPANIRYILANNPTVERDKVEECPNSQRYYIEKRPMDAIIKERSEIRKKYGIPLDSIVFIYGGNLGKPQGIDFLVDAINHNSSRKDCFFVIAGDGTEYTKLCDWIQNSRPANCVLIHRLPKEEYDALVRACDVGIICLDHRFTIPNYPSRLLSYMEFKMPIIAATDPNTDIGIIAQQNGYGYWCESNSVADFTELLEKIIHSDIKTMGQRAYYFMQENYTIDRNYSVIMKHFR